MKTNLNFEQRKKRRINPFLTMSIVILIVVAAMAFSALDIFVLSEDAPVAEAGAVGGVNATLDTASTVQIALGGEYGLRKGSSRYTRNCTLRLYGVAGAAYRNGAMSFQQQVYFNTTAHDDFGGFVMSGPNFTTRSAEFGRGDSWRYHGFFSSNIAAGSGRDYTMTLSFWADDSGSYWAPFKNYDYDTDSYVTPYVNVQKNTDTTGPTCTIASGNNSTWSINKTIFVNLADNMSGVDPSSITMNGVKVTGTENGRSVLNVSKSVDTKGTNNLVVVAYDYFGNKSTTNFTIGYIDTAVPTVVTQMYANTTAWTNQSVTLTAVVKDIDSGIKSFTLAGSTQTYPVNTTGNVTKSVVVSSNNTYTASAIDHVNKSVTLNNYAVSNIDKTVPVINNIYRSPDWTNKDVKLYVRATDAGGSGLTRVRITASGIDTNMTPASGTINGFTYTHIYTATYGKGAIPYSMTAYDAAGNISSVSTLTPNIDMTLPTFGTPILTGKRINPVIVVNAATTYSNSNITVKVPCSDSGGSGVKEAKLNGVTRAILENNMFVFENIITADSAVIGSYTIELWDKAGNTSTTTITPKKDATTPDAIAIGNFDWQNTGQTIQASVWTGLSGGEVQLKRTYLGGAAGDTIQTQTTANYASYPAGTSMYNGANKVYRPLNYVVSQEGEEFYHFRVISGTGVTTPWKGLGGANETAATITHTGNDWTFTSNGARTRFDKTPPEVKLKDYITPGGVTIVSSQFNDPQNYISETFLGRYRINDGMKTAGGNRSEGINSSGLSTAITKCATYTISYGLVPSSVQIYQETDCNHKFDGNFTKSLFNVSFSNQGLIFNGTVRTPVYSITVKDKAKNATTFTETPYIDDVAPKLSIASAKEVIDANTQKDYAFTTEHAWTKQNIIFNLNKEFGQSGATIKWFIDTTKGKNIPDKSSSVWQTSTNDTYGTLTDGPLSITASITIPTKSFDATIFFLLCSKAKTPAGDYFTSELFRIQEGVLYKNFYIAVDNDKPNIVKYAFTDNTVETLTDQSKTITANEWSGSNVYLHVKTTDNPQNGIPGSGVKSVKVTISGGQTEIPMTKMGTDYWRSTNLIGSAEYVIDIEDNVGLISDNSGANQTRYKTFKPDIDTVVPGITVTTGAYESKKGGYSTGSYKEAIPTTTAVTTQTSSVGENNGNIMSGAKLYYMKRSVADFQTTRYTVGNVAGKTMINWSTQSGLWTLLSTIGVNKAFNTIPLSVGATPDTIEHFGYDFLIISGAGHMVHLEYGTIFVDRQAPKLLVDQIVYTRDDGLLATGIIPEPGGTGMWTNAMVEAKLYVTDYEGSGVSEVRLQYQKGGVPYDILPLRKEGLNEYGRGFYVFDLDSYIDYTVYYIDKAGNSGTYVIKPLIDRQAPTIALNAYYGEKPNETTYNINPDAPGGVSYIDKDITIDIILTYGVSSFDSDNTTYAKGSESYSLWYSPDNQVTMYNITTKIGSDTSWTNTTGCGSTFSFVSHSRSTATYTMLLKKDQSTSYYFEVRNGVPEKNASGSTTAPLTYAVPMGSGNQPYFPKVMIDQTAPTISDIVYKANGAIIESITTWTHESIDVSFKLVDNDYGSGVLHDTRNTGDERTSVMLVKRDTSASQGTITRTQLTMSSGLYNFVMDGYYNYYIEYEDNIGNGKRTDLNDILGGKVGGIYGPIKPLIDKQVPDFKRDDNNKVIVDAKSNGIAYVGNWTPYNVSITLSTTVGISGQKLQYSSKNVKTNLWGEWTDITGSGIENGSVPELSGTTYKDTKKTFEENANTGECRFRVISGSALATEYEYGWIRIDKVKPTISVTAKVGTTTYVENTWTKGPVNFKIIVTRGESGSTIEVTTNEGNWNNSITINAATTEKDATLTLSTTTNTPVQYYFRVKSGAELETGYTFGYVKIDNVSPEIACSLAKFEEGELVYNTGILDYAETWRKVNNEHNYKLGEWTSSYVLLRIVSTIGPSGGKIEYSNGSGYTNTYLDNNTFAASGTYVHTSYLLIKDDQDKHYTIKAKTNTENETVSNLSVNDGNIKIDKTVPYMDFGISSGNKSGKWTSEGVNDLHKWYTSNATLMFYVGKFDETNTVVEGYPISGATVSIRYSYNDGTGIVQTGWSTKDISNNAQNMQGLNPTFIVKNNVDTVQTFEFKITSGAGKEFIIAKASPDLAKFEGLWKKALTNDDIGTYTIKVDTTIYNIDIEQWVKGYQKEGVDGNNNPLYKKLNSVNNFEMAKLTIKINGVEISSTQVGEAKRYAAKRGDNVTISIVENAYDDNKSYGYIFKRVEFAGGELNATGDAYETENKTLERGIGEEFDVDIFGQNYNMKAYFTMEIGIAHNNLVQYKQTTTIPVTVGSSYNPNNVPENDRAKHQGLINSAFNELTFITYHTGTSYYPTMVNYDESILSPTEVGQYALKVSLANDNDLDPSYKIHNTEGDELQIKYFKIKNDSGKVYYEINNIIDMGYINIYNDSDSKFDFLGVRCSDAEYRQTTDIEIGKDYTPIYGVFSGTYDGRNYEIRSAVTIEANGVFGIFESISGKVWNLGIWLHLINVTNGTNAGFLAGSSNGGNITNCYAIGEMFINGTNANIGGLVGYIYGETVAISNYTDIAMSNKGKALSGNVGGMFGLVDNATMKQNYVIGAIEAYALDDTALNIGTFAGSILSTMEDGDTSNDNEDFYGNKYLEGNLFVNEEIMDNGGKGYIANTVYTNGTTEIEGVQFNSILSSNYGDLALARIAELGMDTSESNGTVAYPFKVDSTAGLAFIDKYVWAHYNQTADIVLDAGYEFETIAAHKVFTGSYDGKSSGYVDGVYVVIYSNITNVTMNSVDRNTGMFGKVAGTIKNVDIRNLDININYVGTDDAYAGGIAAILLPGARLEMVYVQGTIVASTPKARLRIGGIVGIADGATLIDTLSLANVKTVNTYSVDIGGTVGRINDSTMRKIFSLARVEGKYTSTGSVGAIAGAMLGTTSLTMSDYYALLGNTYVHGQSYDYLAGYAPGATIVLNNTNLNFMTFEMLRGSSQLRFETDNSKELDTILQDIYGLTGKGTSSSPFLIYTVEDFALINNYLYANYRIRTNLNFVNGSTTIGYGAIFTGSIYASMEVQEYIDQGNTGPRNYKIEGLTDAFIYHNAGTIQDIRLDIRYNQTKNEETTFGAVAIKNSGTIQGVTVEGHIILKVTGGGRAIVGGFVGEDLGGEFIQFESLVVQEPSKELSSITSILITVTASQIYVGGFVGQVSGPTLLSYVISNGDIICFGGSVSAGTIVGAVMSEGTVYENAIEASATIKINGEDATKDYGFNIVE